MYKIEYYTNDATNNIPTNRKVVYLYTKLRKASKSHSFLYEHN